MEEQINHKVVIDDYQTLIIKIPKELTIEKFKAITRKVNALFKLSEPKITITRKRLFSDDMTKELIKLKKGGLKGKKLTQTLNEKFDKNLNEKQVFNKIKYLTMTGQLK